jgi:hypothetical protein
MGEKPTEAEAREAGSASGIAIGEEGVQRTGGAMSAIQNIRARAAAPGGGADPTPAEAANLNLSKSNINRLGEGAGDESEPAEATNLNSSRSNRVAGPGDVEPEPSESTVKGSKSNTSE